MDSFIDMFQVVAGNVWLYVGSFLLVLSILVFVHEWGHYIVARKCGVRVETFSIGFGRELFGITDSHGTRWKFSLIPLGGYVKMYGDVDPASAEHSDKVGDGADARPMSDDERKVAFFAQSVGKRAAIVFAGPAINFIFAIILMWGLFVFYGQPVTPPIAAAIVKGSAAEMAKLQPQDEVISIDGKRIRRFEDIRREIMVGLDSERVIKVKREGQIIEIKARPKVETEEDRFGFKHARGMLGVISPGYAIQIDRITAVDGKPVKNADEARAALMPLMGKVFSVEVNRAVETVTYFIRPTAENNKDLLVPDSKGYGTLIIAGTESEVFLRHGVMDGLMEAVHQTVTITRNTLEAIGQIITGTRSATELGGVIRIGAMAGDMVQSGLVAAIMFTALLSINLGLINLFPIPLLDGGHLVFYAAEAARGAPISEQIQEYAFRAGMVFLVGLMVFSNLNDIVQLIL